MRAQAEGMSIYLVLGNIGYFSRASRCYIYMITNDLYTRGQRIPNRCTYNNTKDSGPYFTKIPRFDQRLLYRDRV